MWFTRSRGHCGDHRTAFDLSRVLAGLSRDLSGHFARGRGWCATCGAEPISLGLRLGAPHQNHQLSRTTDEPRFAREKGHPALEAVLRPSKRPQKRSALGGGVPPCSTEACPARLMPLQIYPASQKGVEYTWTGPNRASITGRLTSRPPRRNEAHGETSSRCASSDLLGAGCLFRRTPLNFDWPRLHAEKWFDLVEKQTEQNWWRVNSAIRKEADKLIGGVGLEGPGRDRSHRSEIGYWLAKPFWNRGIMTASGITDRRSTTGGCARFVTCRKSRFRRRSLDVRSEMGDAGSFWAVTRHLTAIGPSSRRTSLSALSSAHGAARPASPESRRCTHPSWNCRC